MYLCFNESEPGRTAWRHQSRLWRQTGTRDKSPVRTEPVMKDNPVEPVFGSSSRLVESADPPQGFTICNLPIIQLHLCLLPLFS